MKKVLLTFFVYESISMKRFLHIVVVCEVMTELPTNSSITLFLETVDSSHGGEKTILFFTHFFPFEPGPSTACIFRQVQTVAFAFWNCQCNIYYKQDSQISRYDSSSLLSGSPLDYNMFQICPQKIKILIICFRCPQKMEILIICFKYVYRK